MTYYIILIMTSICLFLQSSRSFSAVRKIPRRLPVNIKNKDQFLLQEERARAQDFISFVDSSPEPFHVVETVIQRLKKVGFELLDETSLWGKKGTLKKGGKYYYTRNKSTIVAFTIGGKYDPIQGGFKVIGAHTDSPNLKVKPRSKRASSGLTQINVEPYGGGLWHTWFDRDLSIAGRVIINRSSSGEGIEDDLGNGYRFEHRLVKIDRPILRVPNLCIHLRSAEEREVFKLNKEDHLSPILCSEISKSLDSTTSAPPPSYVVKEEKADEGEGGSKDGSTEVDEPDQWTEGQQPELLDVLAEELGCKPSEIADFELSLYDTQGAALSGSRSEFLCGSRLDNLASCFVAIQALEDFSRSGGPSPNDGDGGLTLEEDTDVSIVALFDHEEVGSASNAGAGSPIMRDAVVRISSAMTMASSGAAVAEDSEVFKAALARSMILSVDMAHAVHPNYAAKHESGHAPRMNAGVVIKSNSNQRYATNGITGFFARELARSAGVPVQEFTVRNDCPCGSTIGPVISENTGIRAVDLGMPQLSMHSIREMMGVSDLTFAHRLFFQFLRSFRRLDSALKVDGL